VAGYIAGAVNIPLAELAGRLRDIPFDASPVFVCRSGAVTLLRSTFLRIRSQKAAQFG